jgi:tetratricopeptide (TPR) repeat protein
MSPQAFQDTQPTDGHAQGMPPPGFEPSAYPRRYRPGALARALHAAVAVTFAAAALGLGAMAWQETGLRGAADGEFGLWALAAGAMALLAIWVALIGARREVVLGLDTVQVQGVLGRRNVRLDQLAGRRQPTGLGGSVARLETLPGQGRPLDLPTGLATDLAWDLWLQRLADLDLRDVQASLARMPQLDGSDAGTWLQRFERIQRNQRYAVSVVATLVALSLGRWPLVAQVSFGLLMVAPLLVLAWALSGRGALRLNSDTRDARPSMLGLFGLACLAPWPRLMGDINLADPWQHAGWVAALGLACGGMLWWWLARWRGLGASGLVAVAPLAGLYLAGAALWGNQVGPQPTQATHRAVASYKGYTLRQRLQLFLRVEPWVAGQSARDMNVPPEVFNAVSPGETVCLHQHAGRMGWPWLQVQPCPQPRVAGTDWPPVLYRALRMAAHPPVHQRRLAQALRADRIDEVNQELLTLQQRYERGEVTSMDLLVAYRDFYDPDPDLDGPLNRWVERHPTSFAAWMARGTHRKFQGIALGHAGFGKWVSPELNEDQALDQQVSDLLHAARLTAKPGLAYLHLLDVADHRGQRDQMHAWLAAGTALDTGDLALQRKAMYLLQREGLDAMRGHAQNLRDQGAPAGVMDTVQALVHIHEGVQHLRARRQGDALEAFRRAQALNPWPEDMARALLEEAHILSTEGRHAEALPVARRATEILPDDARSHALLAYALQRLDRMPEAVPVMERAATLGDAWAQARFGQMLLQGQGVPQDTEAAARWISRGAQQGSPEAIELLRRRPELRRPG